MTPRWVALLLGRLGLGHSPSVHFVGPSAGTCRACPDDRQPRWQPMPDLQPPRSPGDRIPTATNRARCAGCRGHGDHDSWCYLS